MNEWARIRLGIASVAVMSALMLGPSPARAQVDEQKARSLYDKMMAHYEKKEYDAAITVSEELLKLIPNQPTVLYNTACLHSLAGHKPEALDTLERAVAAGFRDLDHIANDADFKGIREEARFKAIVKQLTDEAVAARERAANPVYKVHVPKDLDASKAVPLLVAMHGLGGNADDMIRAWSAATDRAGVILVSVQGPSPMGENRFNWFGQTDTIELVKKAFEDTAGKHKIDDKRIILTGFSQGGWMTYRMISAMPARIAGAIPVAGRADGLNSRALSASLLEHMRVFIMVGDQEESRMIETNRNAESDLKKAGATVHLEVYKGIGHEFPRDGKGEIDQAELDRALKFVLGRDS